MQVVITGVRGDDRLRLALSPGPPPRSVVYQEAATQAVNGIPGRTTASFRGQSDGRTLTTCAADFWWWHRAPPLNTSPPCRIQSTWLTEVLAWTTGADSGFTTEHLNATIHPITGAPSLRRKGQAGGGVVVPVSIPPPHLGRSYPLE